MNVEDRLCTQCNTLEDEFHCLVECTRFVNERKRLLPVSLRIRPSMFEFVKFIKCKESSAMLGQLSMKVMKEYRKTCV